MTFGGPKKRIANVAKDLCQVIDTVKVTKSNEEKRVSDQAHPPTSTKTQSTQTDTVEDRAYCEHCNLHFGDRLMLCMHLGIHSLENPLKCNVCRYVCRDKMEFFSHLTWGHGKN